MFPSFPFLMKHEQFKIPSLPLHKCLCKTSQNSTVKLQLGKVCLHHFSIVFGTFNTPEVEGVHIMGNWKTVSTSLFLREPTPFSLHILLQLGKKERNGLAGDPWLPEEWVSKLALDASKSKIMFIKLTIMSGISHSQGWVQTSRYKFA